HDFALTEPSFFPQPHRDVVADGKGIEERRKLKHIADFGTQLVQLLARESRNLDSIDPNRSAIGFEQSDNVLDRDGCAGAGVPNEDHCLAFSDVEGESLQYLLGPEGFVDVDELDHVTKMGTRLYGGRGKGEGAISRPNRRGGNCN